MKPERQARTCEELKVAATHVCYEWDMLVASADFLGSVFPWRASPETERNNIALEAFLLHYRCLRAFLCPSLQSLYNDDVIASDFVDKVTPEDYGAPTELGIDKDRMDKMLAHISYGRATYEKNGNQRR